MVEDIELRHLRYFLVLAEELHFTRAAERLGIAQPPLSQQIQRLEELLGTKLFVRRPRVKLTEAGEAMLTVARRTLAQAKQGFEDVRRTGSGEGGTLMVGFATSALFSPLPDIMRAYRKRYPGVKLSLHELSTDEQQEELNHGIIEVAFLRENPTDESLASRAIIVEPYILALPSRHPLSEHPVVDLADVAGEPFVHFTREAGPRLYDELVGLCRAAGFEPMIAQEAPEWLTVVGLVEAGLGVAFVPASFRKLCWGTVTYRPLRNLKAQTSVTMCHRPHALSPQAGQLIRLVDELLAGT